MPWWAFKSLMLIIVNSLVTIPMVAAIPDTFPLDEDQLFRSGLNADAVELEPEEKGGRAGYDQPNFEAESRRELIREENKIILMANEEALKSFNKKKMSVLIKHPSLQMNLNLPEIEDEDEFEDNKVGEVEEEQEEAVEKAVTDEVVEQSPV